MGSPGILPHHPATQNYIATTQQLNDQHGLLQMTARSELSRTNSPMHQTSHRHGHHSGEIWRSFQNFDQDLGSGEASMPRSLKRKLDQEEQTMINQAMMTKKKTSEKRYRRHAKPPYSYVGLIALAIQSSPNKMLKLSEILARISTMFPFFKGEYQGWRDSVRHNLSQNKCFKKVLPDPSRPQSKGNYWTVDINKIPAEKLKRQNTTVSRNVAPGFRYARNLTDIFDLETGQLKTSPNQSDMGTISAICGSNFDQNSPGSSVGEDPDITMDCGGYPNCTTAPRNTHSSEIPSHQQKYTNSTNIAQVNRETSPSSYSCTNSDLSNRLSPQSCQSNSAPNTPCSSISTSSDKQTGVLHYNGDVQFTTTPTSVNTTSQSTTSNVKEKNEHDEEVYPPPNMAPFGDGVKKPSPPPSGRPTPPSTPETTNIDYSFGPIGPPNVNLTSCDDLSKIGQNKSTMSKNFPDQYNFIKEQAEILSGRNIDTSKSVDYNNNNNSNSYYSTPPSYCDISMQNLQTPFYSPLPRNPLIGSAEFRPFAPSNHPGFSNTNQTKSSPQLYNKFLYPPNMPPSPHYPHANMFNKQSTGGLFRPTSF